MGFRCLAERGDRRPGGRCDPATHGVGRGRLVGRRLRPARWRRTAARPSTRVSLGAHRRRDGRGVRATSVASASTASPASSSCRSTPPTNSSRPRDTAEYARAHTLLMVPDLVNLALCGSTTNDVTNASTTQLLDVGTRSWSDELVADLGLRRDLLPGLHEPGVDLGAVRGIGADGRRLAGDRRRQPRHRERSCRHAVAPRPSGRLHLVRHVVARRVRAAGRRSPPSEALAANVTNELGVGGTRAAAQERDRALAARGVQADVGGAGACRRMRPSSSPPPATVPAGAA